MKLLTKNGSFRVELHDVDAMTSNKTMQNASWRVTYSGPSLKWCEHYSNRLLLSDVILAVGDRLARQSPVYDAAYVEYR